jgi:hypothetical protein
VFANHEKKHFLILNNNGHAMCLNMFGSSAVSDYDASNAMLFGQTSTCKLVLVKLFSISLVQPPFIENNKIISNSFF